MNKIIILFIYNQNKRLKNEHATTTPCKKIKHYGKSECRKDALTLCILQYNGHCLHEIITDKLIPINQVNQYSVNRAVYELKTRVSPDRGILIYGE